MSVIVQGVFNDMNKKKKKEMRFLNKKITLPRHLLYLMSLSYLGI